MQSEARLLPGHRVACSGGRADAARKLALQLLSQGAHGLLSFGIAGGLRPGLLSGQLLIGSAVIVDDACLPTDRTWHDTLVSALPMALSGVLAHSDQVVATAEDKARLYQQSSALAVDMESGAVALACQQAGKPFAVLRAIADPAQRAIPPLALLGLDADGRTRPWPVIAGLMRSPEQLPALVRVGRDSRQALAALAGTVDSVGLLT
ncbi:MAG TPA: nucleoside phosphorylase [Rhodospirillaceae bacterium]|nr:nucleoside phosphorylase [Rhodospirillaceae bacterium]